MGGEPSRSDAFPDRIELSELGGFPESRGRALSKENAWRRRKGRESGLPNFQQSPK